MNLTRARLQQLLDAYGADPRRWPGEERAAAEALLRGEPADSPLRRDAAALDTLLDRLPAVADDAALRSTIFAALPARERPSGWREALAELAGRVGGWRLAGPAFALALAGGVASGVLLESETQAGVATLEAAAESPDDLLALAQLDAPAWSDVTAGEAE
ncbi:MAG TPA: hypothetical protein VM369_01780 [Candidatus Binatia bacterium]|nr:hypothetical protein [Candidatus Binatia bacterium]